MFGLSEAWRCHPDMREREMRAVCRCLRCGEVIDFCTRDNPCPRCGSSLFTVNYKSDERPAQLSDGWLVEIK